MAARRRRGARPGLSTTWGSAGTAVPTTLRFCDELQRLYGSEDDRIAEGASFAVENWAAAGFWQELEDGLLQIKATRLPGLKVAFFTWHNRVEAQHAGHTMEELEDVFFSPKFDHARFFQGAHEVLDAIAIVLGRPGRRSAPWRGRLNSVVLVACSCTSTRTSD